MRQHSRIHIGLGLRMIVTTARNNGFYRLDSRIERRVMRRVTAQISLHFALALQQHRVNDILCVLGPLRSQQCKRQQPLMFCVSVSVLSELFRQVPRWIRQHNLHGDRN